jgi:hypothetical protein
VTTLTLAPTRRLSLSPQQRACIALACEIAPRPLRTTLVMARFGWSRNKAYKVLARLRAKGIFRSQLNWITGRNGIHVPRKGPRGENQLMSWLELHLQPEAEWGRSPDEKQLLFQPRPVRAARAAGGEPCARCDLELAVTRYMGQALCQGCVEQAAPGRARAA